MEARPGGVSVRHVQIQFAIDDAATADAIVEGLLRGHLVACGQRTGPISSHYWWEGALERSEEWLVLLKTRADLAAAVVEAIVERHPYEIPEVLVLDVAGGSARYLEWVDGSTAQRQ
jgi:periplasmic divalent cation tolerance protein